ncbi:MAG: DNA gyrase subunit A, partial [Bdellovibrionales bacterium]|nr:DNA gyrase subunit A [Bdellovibrionales bacterium]NQZ17677.1 DNA gyrase subunit A [Bdellovibrionales bacterium]
MSEENIDNVSQIDINQEMREAYLQYSMSVIVGRALPDIRDGLKPVHRRILYAMHDLRNTHDKPYKKSARVVGDVIGKYHPHGDTAVYDSMVRMAQDFSLRYPLVDGQGNFGSIDGDSPAAQRYTEVRMTKLAEAILEDIEKETVPFGPNYDDSLMIPKVLPSKFPNLLVNGSSGIAVGMATNIPPHNLGEIIDGCVALIDNPETSTDELIQLIPGPDFPTAGIISGRQGIMKAYKKGHGIIKIRAVAEIIEKKSDKQEIHVTEIPYQVNKARLIESIADLVRDKKIEGISDIRDESSREGMQIVIVLKRNENANVILNQLYKYTQMQVSFGIRMLALDARNQPRMFDIKSALEAFITHRKDIVTKRCLFELKKAEARAHILEGLQKALDNIDEIVATIKASKETAAARIALMDKFEFSERQAQAILDMKLSRLTGLEKQKIVDELKELREKIEWLRSVLADVNKIYAIIKEELIEIKTKHSNPRRTQISADAEEIDDEDLIAQETMVVTLTQNGYIKRIPIEQYKKQKRGGKGLKGAGTREEDYVTSIFVAETKTTLLVFTDKGKVYWTKVHKLPQGSRTSKGKAVVNVININKEKVQAVLPVTEFQDDKYVVMVTQKGIIKKTPLSAFSRPRPSGIIALTTDLDEELLQARISDGKCNFLAATKKGQSIRFDEGDVRPMGRNARGVKAITLANGDEVVGLEVLPKDSQLDLLVCTTGGYGKRVPVEDYRTQGRGGSGIITQKSIDKLGELVTAKGVIDTDDVVITTDQGQTIRMSCKDVSKMGRNTQGVRLIS